jgi:hypothetical protein
MFAGFAVSGESDMVVTFLTSSALVTGHIPRVSDDEAGDNPSLFAAMAITSAVNGETVVEAMNGEDIEQRISEKYQKQLVAFAEDRFANKEAIASDAKLNDGPESDANDGCITLTDVKIRSICDEKAVYSFPSFTLFFDQIAGVTLEDGKTSKD